jgi:hypothetical protein
MLKSIISY